MFSTQFTSGISLPNGGLLLNALCLIALLLFGPAAAMNSYRYNRIGRMMNAGGGERSNNGNQMSAFFGQSMPSIAERRAAFESGSRDASSSSSIASAEFTRTSPSASAVHQQQQMDIGDGAEKLLAEEIDATRSRMPRANNSKFVRKNCFFSPLQCSFYYKSNNFANMMIKGDEH